MCSHLHACSEVTSGELACPECIERVEGLPAPPVLQSFSGGGCSVLFYICQSFVRKLKSKERPGGGSTSVSLL